MEAVCAPSPSTEHASCFEDWLLWVLEECADNDHTLGWCVQCWPPSPPAWLGAGGPIYLWPFWWLASHVGNGVPPCPSASIAAAAGPVALPQGGMSVERFTRCLHVEQKSSRSKAILATTMAILNTMMTIAMAPL